MITIKDVCTILGIAPSTIRLYEKCLPAVPWSVEDNGYRGFYFENILHLADCRTMVKYGMSLQEAFGVSLAKSLEAKEGALDRQRDRLVEEVRHLNDLLLVIDEQRALMAKISTLIEGYEVVDMPAFFHFPSRAIVFIRVCTSLCPTGLLPFRSWSSLPITVSPST